MATATRSANIFIEKIVYEIDGVVEAATIWNVDKSSIWCEVFIPPRCLGRVAKNRVAETPRNACDVLIERPPISETREGSSNKQTGQYSCSVDVWQFRAALSNNLRA